MVRSKCPNVSSGCGSDEKVERQTAYKDDQGLGTFDQKNFFPKEFALDGVFPEGDVSVTAVLHDGKSIPHKLEMRQSTNAVTHG